jgi:hypothetical protein
MPHLIQINLGSLIILTLPISLLYEKERNIKNKEETVPNEIFFLKGQK